MKIRYLLKLFVALLLVSSVAFAGDARSYLKAKQGELTSIIKKPKSAANDTKLKATFDALLDYDALAKNSLGDHWADRSDAERAEFQKLLTRLVQSAYTKNIRNTLDYNIEFGKSQPAKTGGKLILTVAKHKTDPHK